MYIADTKEELEEWGKLKRFQEIDRLKMKLEISANFFPTLLERKVSNTYRAVLIRLSSGTVLKKVKY